MPGGKYLLIVFIVYCWSFCVAQNQKIIFVKEVNEAAQAERGIYSVGRYRICTVDTDGSNLRILTETNLFYPQVFPSHNGELIAFAAMKKNGLCLCTIDVTGGNEKVLLEAMTGISQIAWSADDTKLLYVDLHNICLKELEGERDVRLTDGNNLNPQWLPDGKHCIYTSLGREGSGAYSRLALLNVDSVGLNDYADDVNYLTRPLRNVYNSRLSNRGGKVVAFSDAGTDWQELMEMNFFGDSVKTVGLVSNFDGKTFDRVSMSYFSVNSIVSQDRPKISVKADSANADSRVNTRGPKQGDGNPVRDWIAEAAWSPDGNKLACRMIEEGKNELLVMNADGSGKNRIVSTKNISEISWSPDGTQILYCSGGKRSQIGFMNANGSNQHTLSVTIDGFSPCWVEVNSR